jgi:hypothetical protein
MDLTASLDFIPAPVGKPTYYGGKAAPLSPQDRGLFKAYAPPHSPVPFTPVRRMLNPSHQARSYDEVVASAVQAHARPKSVDELVMSRLAEPGQATKLLGSPSKPKAGKRDITR